MKKIFIISFVIVSILVGLINIQTTFAKTEKNTNGVLSALQISPLKTILKSARAQVRIPPNPLTPNVASKLASLMSSNNPDAFIKEVRNFLKKAPNLRNYLISPAVAIFPVNMIENYAYNYPQTKPAMLKLSDALTAQGRGIYFDISVPTSNSLDNGVPIYESGQQLVFNLNLKQI